MHILPRVACRLRHAALLVLIVLSIQPLLSRPALAWWNGDWSYRMKITADAGPKGAAVTDPIGRTQILLRLHSGNFNFATAKSDGADLRIVAGDDRTPLHFHIEHFDGLIDQVGLIWIDVPDLAPGTETPFYVYWGNKNATNAGDSRGTYDADQLLVYHFDEDNGLPKDATGYGNNALTAGKQDAAGLVGNGLRLDGKTPIHLTTGPSLAIHEGQGMTWSMWVHPDLTAAAASSASPPAADATAQEAATSTANTPTSTPPAPTAPTPDAAAPNAAAPGAPAAPASGAAGFSAILFAQRDGANAITIGIDHGVAYAQIETPDGVKRTSVGAPITGDGWHHIAVEASDHLTVYVDGKPQGDVAAALPAIAGQAMLGGDVPATAPASPAPATPAADGSIPAPAAAPAPTPAPADATSAAPATPATPAAATPALPNYVGQIDEFQISRVARPVGALALAVADQGPNPKLLTFNTAEEGSFFGSGYIGIIMRSVTPDAWVVIGLLGVMAVVSWIVMVGKVMYLNRVTGANRVFLDAFEGALADAADDNRAAFHSVSAMKQPILQRSSLYRVYEVGSRELAMRLDSRKHRISGMLTPQAVAAIRSALDGALVRETQRLGRLMVLLTIAISGGPFLGLLGTVVGVMITFASIAQAGDVNVNAIAPGISAALLATVAGLAVAIPALFAYNYFNSRIRDAIAEMQIFVDELATRMAEGFDAPFDGIPETKASAVVERVR